MSLLGRRSPLAEMPGCWRKNAISLTTGSMSVNAWFHQLSISPVIELRLSRNARKPPRHRAAVHSLRFVLPEPKTLEDRAALVEVGWLSPGPFRAADQFSLGNSANPPFVFPRSDKNQNS